MDIGENIKKHRTEAGLSREKLVVECNGLFSASHLLKIENEEINNPGINLLVGIADALEVSLDELIGRKPPKKKA